MKIIESILKKLGYTKTNKNIAEVSDKDFLLKNFYRILHDFNFIPKHIVDIGANHGTWTREALKHFPNAKFTLLEPQHWLKESFSDLLKSNSNVRFFPYGAGKKKGEFNFTILDRDDSCTFRFSDDEAKKEGFEQIKIPVVTLNDLLFENNLSIPDIIKIDAEGLDIDVLNGASNYFGKTEIFMVEAGIVNKEFENSFLNLINTMDKNGYRLFEITDLNRPFIPNVLWLVELVFVLKNGFIDSKKIT